MFHLMTEHSIIYVTTQPNVSYNNDINSIILNVISVWVSLLVIY